LARRRRGGGRFRTRLCRCRRNKKQRSTQRRKNRRKTGQAHPQCFFRPKHQPASPKRHDLKTAMHFRLQKKTILENTTAKKFKLPRRQFLAPENQKSCQL